MTTDPEHVYERLDEWLDGQLFDMDGQPISSREWQGLIASHEARRVARDEIGDVVISTVLLVLNHNYDPSGPPLIFETMIFGRELDQEQWRYSTKEEALEGHARAVELVRLEQALEAS